MKATPTEIKQIVEGSQQFLKPVDDPRDNELFDASKPETPPLEENLAARPMKPQH